MVDLKKLQEETYQNKNEKLDIYNENRVKTGKVIERKDGENIKENEFVLVVQCWILNSKKEILLTQRRLDKTNGGMWEATSGLVQAGENSIEGIKRELKEEIGLDIDINDLKLLKTVKEGNTFRDVYTLNKDIPIENINFSDGEVIGAKYVTAQEFEQMIDSGEAFEWSRWFVNDYEKI